MVDVDEAEKVYRIFDKARCIGRGVVSLFVFFFLFFFLLGENRGIK
jgi:hypothetical protein